MAVAPLILAGPARGNPEGATVAAGQVSVSSAGTTTTITQTTQRAIVNWQGFSIGAGETTRFVQPGAASAILNRVTGGDPSKLMGQLTSNGRVYLINPHGVVVGPEGRVNTGGFVASTLDVPDAQFLGGGPLTFQGTSGAGIKVLGTVQAADGDVVLVAANIEAKGRIAAPNGQAILGAGGSVLYMPGGGDIVVEAPAPRAAIDAGGTVEAAAVQLKAAGSAYALAVNAGGAISATAVHDVGGRVVIDGGDGDVAVTGAITARRGQDGGEVRVLTGGATRFEGSISARAGETGGDGGFVEVSGKAVDFLGRVDVAAPRGRGGQLLIDPVNATIDNTNVAGYVATLDGGGSVTVDATSSLTVDAAVASSNTLAVLRLDAPNIAINADIDLGGSLQLTNSEFFNSSTTGSLTLASSATIDVGQVYLPGNFDTVDLQGVVVTPDFSVDTGHSPLSFAATNAGNRIDAFSAVQVTTFSGDVAVTSSTPMTVSGEFNIPGDLTLRTTSGDLTVGSGTVLAVDGTATLAGANAFVNNAGSGLFIGNGRRLIYTSTEASPFSDGGLGYTHHPGVAFGADPLGSGNVIYVSSAVPLLTITADSFTRLYGQPDPTFTASFSGGAAADLTSPVQFRIAQGEHFNAGTYTIVPFGAVAPGFDLQYLNGVLTVTPAPLTIAAIDLARLYGAPNPTLTASFSGLVNGDTSAVVSGLILATTATSASGVGGYAITGSGASAANYTISYLPGLLTVNPAPLTIAANGTTRTYGAPNPTFSSTFEGLVNGDTPAVVSGLAIATTATQASGLGLYPVTASGGSAANYTISYRPGELLIQPAPLTVRANDASQMAGAPLPPFSASYSGLQNGDDPGAVLDVAFHTDAYPGAAPGAYGIRPTAQFRGAANYTLTLVNGTLTVVQQPVIVQSAIFTTSNIQITPKPPEDKVELIIGKFDLTPPDLTEFGRLLNSPPSQVSVCNQLCYAFGRGPAGQEFDRVLADLATQVSGGAQPPITVEALRSSLIFPDKASEIMGLLLPMLYTHLTDILAKPQPWTAGETAFVQQFASYMDAQRRAAADLALADYQAWAYAQREERTADINSLKNGDLNTATQIYVIGMKSLEPPVPPVELIQEIQVGMALNNGQLQAVTDYTYEVGQLQKDWTDLSTGEAGVKLEGVAQGIRLGASLGMAAGGPGSGSLVKLAPALKTILPNAAKTTAKTAKAARIALEEAGEMLKLAKTASQVAKAAAEVAEAEKVLAAIAKGFTVAEAIPVVGEVIAIVGDIVQIGIAANEYRQVADFNRDFQAAYDAAVKPTSVADLKMKMGTQEGQATVFNYLTAMMATGGLPPVTPKPTVTVTQISQLSLSL